MVAVEEMYDNDNDDADNNNNNNASDDNRNGDQYRTRMRRTLWRRSDPGLMILKNLLKKKPFLSKNEKKHTIFENIDLFMRNNIFHSKFRILEEKEVNK